jgi:hypothetical protein
MALIMHKNKPDFAVTILFLDVQQIRIRLG